MSKELIISSSRHETRVAIMEDDQLVEIYFQRANEYSLAGSIHKGRVTRVLPGMQSAFVDLGLDRDTFLYVSDFFEENGDEYDRIETKPSKPSQVQPRSEPAQIQAPIVEVEEFAAPDEESAKEVGAAPESAERTEEPASGQAAGGQDQRDKRGRRGRRRRTRGRGFPDSKYASDLTSAPTPEEKAIQADDEAEGTAAEEVFLLPGESLAKYSSRAASGSDSEQIEPVDRQPDDPDSPIEQSFAEEALEEERFEAGQIDLVEPDFSEEAEEPNVPYEPSEPLPAAPEVVAAAFPDSAFFTTPVISEPAPEPEQSEETVESASAAGIDVESTEEEESEDEVPVEEPPTDDDKPPVEEPNPDQPLQASVREQNSRYPHRSSRRMRRRGRGGDRDRGGDRNQAEKSGERGAIQTPEREVRAPQIEVVDDRKSAALPSISDLLKEGQEIIVQIAKEPLGQKGARITSHIALPGPLPGLHADGRPHRRLAQDPERRRAPAAEAHSADAPHRHPGRLHRAHRRRRPHAKKNSRADMMFLYNLWLDMRQKAEKQPAPVLMHHDLECRAAHPARSADAAFKSDLGGQRRSLRERPALRAALPAGAGEPREAVHALAPDLRRVRHHQRTREGAAPEGVAEVRRLHRHQPDRSAGGHRRQHRQVRGQVEPAGRHHRQDQHGRHQGDRAADPPARPGRHHRGRLHRHGRAQESPEGDAGARRSHARRSRAVQDSAVQRFRSGGDHPQAREAEPGADALHAVSRIAKARAT